MQRGGAGSVYGNLLLIPVAAGTFCCMAASGLLLPALAQPAIIYLMTFYLSTSTPKRGAELSSVGVLGSISFRGSALFVQRVSKPSCVSRKACAPTGGQPRQPEKPQPVDHSSAVRTGNPGSRTPAESCCGQRGPPHRCSATPTCAGHGSGRSGIGLRSAAPMAANASTRALPSIINSGVRKSPPTSKTLAQGTKAKRYWLYLDDNTPGRTTGPTAQLASLGRLTASIAH